MKKLIFFALSLLSSFSILANNYPTPGDIIRNYFSTVDGGNAAELEKLLADNFSAVTPLAPSGANKQIWVATMQGFKAAFPDMKHEITSVVENGFWVAVSGAFTGKNDGPMMGAPATGNRVFAPFNAIFELDKSWKVKSINSQFDLKGFDAQLMAGLPNPAAFAELNIRSMLAAADKGDIEKFISYWAPDGKNYFTGKET
ncbi:MAG: nuclear transport factor 2 family protein, partial [Saprospiraceae bacterium]|nr:nuclear transport factor 2 family protein [Saprospiraceae bacterium]